MARTAEEFNLLYEQTNGDPWGYESRYVTDRLDASLEFVSKYLPNAQPLQFIEFGPFDGSFTRRILGHFENAKVLAVEISDHAVAKVRKNLQGKDQGRALVVQGDLVSFDLNSVTAKPGPVVILALECIYYVSPEERARVIANWTCHYPDAFIFISGPINQDRYLDESWLIEQFGVRGWSLVESKVLTVRHVPILGRLRRTSLMLANVLGSFKRRFANQSIFVFKAANAQLKLK